MREIVNVGSKYAIALTVVIGCFYLIATAQPFGNQPPDLTQPWSIITLVVGWIIRDSAGNTATANMVAAAAAQPTVTTGGNPPRTTVTPPDPVS